MAIWKNPVSLEQFNQRSAGTMAEYLDIQFTAFGDDYLIATMPVDHRTKQPLGLLNGGASCALAETVGSTAANYCVDHQYCYCVGLDINCNHIRSAKSGRVSAKATPIHLGKRTHVWQIHIHDDMEHLICISRLTMSVIQRKE